MVDHKIHQHANPSRLRLRHHVIEIRHRPILRSDRRVIRNVVPVIHARRRIHRRNPDRIHAQVLEIIQPRSDPIDIPDPIPIRVLKASWVDLINHRMMPPAILSVRTRWHHHRRPARTLRRLLTSRSHRHPRQNSNHRHDQPRSYKTKHTLHLDRQQYRTRQPTRAHLSVVLPSERRLLRPIEIRQWSFLHPQVRR